MTILIREEDSLGDDHVNHEVANTRLINSSSCSSISRNPLVFLRNNSIVHYPAPFVVQCKYFDFPSRAWEFLSRSFICFSFCYCWHSIVCNLISWRSCISIFFACRCVLVRCSTSIQWNRRTIWREAMELVRPGGDGHLRNASILVLVLMLIPLFSLCFPLRLRFQRMCCLELATFRGMLDEIEKCFYVLRDREVLWCLRNDWFKVFVCCVDSYSLRYR